MIAVDTKVLVRYLTNDDAEQARKAVAVLAGTDRILVTHMVLMELAWVLRAAYDLSPETISRSLQGVAGFIGNLKTDGRHDAYPIVRATPDTMDRGHLPNPRENRR